MNRQTLYLDLLEEIRNTPTIDAHEHLPPEEERLKEPRDFYSLFQHYCQTWVGTVIILGFVAGDFL